jgi:serine phosphatase RsbU (regulator of sigma subunit)
MKIPFARYIFKKENEIHHSSQPDRSVLLYNICMVTAIVSLGLTGLGIYINYELSWYVMPLAALVFFLLGVWSSRSAKLNLIGNLFVATGAIVVISMILFSGGLFSPVVPWVAIGPTFALLLVDRISAWRWTLLMMLVLFWVYLIEDLGLTPQAQYSPETKNIYYIIVFLSLVALVLVINLIFENNTVVALNKVEDQRKQIAEKNQDITASIKYAQNIQSAILPSKLKFKALLPDSFVLFKPKDIVSGDFYWIAEEGGYIFVVAADCTGHGVPGAFMSMIGNEILNKTILGKGIYDPGEILNELHLQVCSALKLEESKVKDGMDISLCRIDTKNAQMEFAGAKNPLLIKRNNEFITIKGNRYPIGGDLEERDYKTESISMKEKDQYYIFSDGLQDQFGGPKDKKLKISRVKETILKASDSMEKQKKDLEQLFYEWKINTEQTDDVLFIGFSIDNPVLE